MIHTIRWQDVLDVVIVAFIIYRLLLLIKGTRALQLVIGLTVVFFAFYIARTLDLFTLGWILNNFVAFAGLIIVVIFQNEIRRVLFALGRSPFFRKITYVDETLFYEELANACVVMSKKRTGRAHRHRTRDGSERVHGSGGQDRRGREHGADSERLSNGHSPARWGTSHRGRTDKSGKLRLASVDAGRFGQRLRDETSGCRGYHGSNRRCLRDRVGGIGAHLLRAGGTITRNVTGETLKRELRELLRGAGKGARNA